MDEIPFKRSLGIDGSYCLVCGQVVPSGHAFEKSIFRQKEEWKNERRVAYCRAVELDELDLSASGDWRGLYRLSETDY
jgi:hypothetical protein